MMASINLLIFSLNAKLELKKIPMMVLSFQVDDKSCQSDEAKLPCFQRLTKNNKSQPYMTQDKVRD